MNLHEVKKGWAFLLLFTASFVVCENAVAQILSEKAAAEKMSAVVNACFEKVSNPSFEVTLKEAEVGGGDLTIRELGYRTNENLGTCSPTTQERGERLFTVISENLIALGAAQLSDPKKAALTQCIANRIIRYKYDVNRKEQHVCVALITGQGICVDYSKLFVAIATQAPMCLNAGKVSGRMPKVAHAFNYVVLDEKIYYLSVHNDDATFWELPPTTDANSQGRIMTSGDVDMIKPPPKNLIKHQGRVNIPLREE